MISVAINGFGRIGRAFTRLVLQDPVAQKLISIKAINCGPIPPENIDLLLKYDSEMGELKRNISQNKTTLTIDNQKIPLFFETDPLKLPWKKLDIDWVIEASGKLTTEEKASLHQKSGAKNVLITAPSPDAHATIIPGVNDDSYNPNRDTIISLGSCTTNCFASIIKVLHEEFELQEGLMTTIHAYTNDQNLVDSTHKDPRRARAAATNIIPTKTGASDVIIEIFPELKGKIKAVALRVPVPSVSIVDFTFSTKKICTTDDINTAFKMYAKKTDHTPLTYTEQPLVSSDFSGHHASVIIDTLLTESTDSLHKVFGWYDNEIGYSAKIKDFILHKAKNIL
ncbi:type I glyceraldehyde-3-phosphate dehydrogenase [Candidatus Dependentiae bacterium]|nr:MAG: type I glyceraldehyde-3-phosphate dehydrogenase [Candidatus Dependentiae bacterium]